jgi:uncharacterized membrane protein
MGRIVACIVARVITIAGYIIVQQKRLGRGSEQENVKMSSQIFTLKLIFLIACIITIIPLIVIVFEYVAADYPQTTILNRLLENA